METDILETILFIVGYIYISFCLQTMARKTNTKNDWFAWIPFANIYLTCKIAGKPAWWTLLIFVPLINIAIVVILWMRIAEILRRPSWWGIVIVLVPVADILLLWYLAFSSKGIAMEKEKAKIKFPFEVIVPIFVLGFTYYFIVNVESPSEEAIISQAGISIDEMKKIDDKLEVLKDPLFGLLKSTLPDEFPIIQEKVGRSNPFAPVR